MENGNSNFLLCFSLGICFILLLSPANAENRTEPRVNANLSPFESWRSAYFCLLNVITYICHFYTQFSGLLTVQDPEIVDYCSGGCYDHTLDVMKCIRDVKRDFKFGNKAPLWFVNNSIVQACSAHKGFNITYQEPNSATSLYGRLYMPLVSMITTLAFIATFNV